MTRQHEYIGVSGVVNQEQQAELEAMFTEFGLREKRALQLGVKATHKTQYLGIENKYGPEWYPVGAGIDNAMCYSGNTRGVMQVCFDAEGAYDEEYRREFLDRALGSAAWQWLTGMQYDMVPDWCCRQEESWDIMTEAMTRATESWRLLHGINIYENAQPFENAYLDYKIPKAGTPERTTILQCQSDIMAHHTPVEIAKILGRMVDISYVLFDASGGRGVRMDTDSLLPYIEAVRSRSELDSLGIAVGGGLNAEVVRSELSKILRHFPGVSWDAEGQLHPVNVDGKRPLDMRVCREYLEASAEVLR